MSAFVVDKSHINAMVTLALLKPYGSYFRFHHGAERIEVTHENADEIGQILLDENVKSVMHRYEDSTITELPGSVNAQWLIPFKYSPMCKIPDAVEAIKLIQCFEYQSCEHPEWEQSKAKAFCEALTRNQFRRLPGYDDAPWDWIDERYYSGNSITRLC